MNRKAPRGYVGDGSDGAMLAGCLGFISLIILVLGVLMFINS